MKQDLINKIALEVQDRLADAESGHDWLHIERVWYNAKLILASEEADSIVVELGALLHDIADSKFHGGDETVGPTTAREIMETYGIDQNTVNHVIDIIQNISFKGGHAYSDFSSKELDIVRDADRLDAIGAIGIARAFTYGGFKNRKMYDRDMVPNLSMSREEYKNNKGPTINHFYEKLLLLKNLMATKTGMELAEERHQFMELFLQQWNREVGTSNEFI